MQNAEKLLRDITARAKSLILKGFLKMKRWKTLDESAYKDIVFTNIIFLVCIIKPEGAHNYLCVYQIHQNWEKRLSMKWFDSVIKASVEEFAHF